MVFSHGLLWSGAHVRRAGRGAVALAGYRCIAYDHRGQGRSATSPSPYDMERLADDAAALIERLGAAPCHFVGLSMGGFVGMRLAARRPELIAHADADRDRRRRRAALNIPKYRGHGAGRAHSGFGPLAGRSCASCSARTFLGDGARAEPSASGCGGELVRARLPRIEAALDVGGAAAADPGELGAIKTPTLVLHGDEDRAIVMPRAQTDGARHRRRASW